MREYLVGESTTETFVAPRDGVVIKVDEGRIFYTLDELFARLDELSKRLDDDADDRA